MPVVMDDAKLIFPFVGTVYMGIDIGWVNFYRR
jgi:hypothetical protein